MPPPIPLLVPESHALTVVRQSAALKSDRAPMALRNFAYTIDFCLVAGCASYFSVLCSLLVLSLHARAIGSLGKGAEPAFLAAYELAGAELFAGSFAFFSVVFWVAIPFIAGKTLGMGLCGLRLRSDTQEGITVRRLLRRLAGCWLNSLTAGALSIPGMLDGQGRFFQDQVSDTSVVADE